MGDPYQEMIWLKQYPGELPAEMEIPALTGLNMWQHSVERYPDGVAMYYFDQALTYGELDALADSLAVGLGELGLGRGDRAIIQLQNIPQYLIALYAVWKTGAVAVTLNPMYKNRELKFYANDSRAKVILAMEDCFPEMEPLLGESSLEYALTTSELDFLQPGEGRPKVLEHSSKVACEGALDLMEFAARYQGRKPQPVELAGDDPGYLTYTSGTTGPPKGAINTHANIAFSTQVYAQACSLGSNDVVVGVAPFFHVTGGIGHVATSSLLGIPLLAFFRFDPGELLRLIEKWRATMMIAPLTVYVALLNHPDFKTRDISSLKVMLSGGAPVSDAFVEKFRTASGCYIHNWYGLTETTSPAIITPIGKKSPVDKDSGALSIGVPVPNSRAKVVDVETGEPIEPGRIGELVLKGPMVVPGYWEKPDETARAFKNGWLYTGDVAKMDEEGWFYLVDRKKDLINVSGYKVWPREVEDVLYQHPAVQEACVIGVPDQYRGETVRGYVTLVPNPNPVPTPEDLIAFCKSRMAAYKYPRQVEIVEELPKTLSGKLLRRELKSKAVEDNN